jgi:predicted secreted acid phosphatase
MNRSTILTGAGAFGLAALGFLFFGTGSRQGVCGSLVQEPANVGLTKGTVRKYRTSGDWETAIKCEVEKAKKLLASYKPAADERPAVIFDIDETSLSNWEMINITDFGYLHGAYKLWENSARDLAVKPIQELYLFAREKGFSIFFISGRREVQRASTEQNLRHVGFDEWEGTFFKPMDYYGGHAMEFKSKWRAHIQSLGYTIVLNIGDQQSDLDGDPHAIYDVKIANPAYFIP